MARPVKVQGSKFGLEGRHRHGDEDRECRVLVPKLLVWFTRNARDLPWRRTRDPYAIWISEIMLQQTQVKTVIPYWERWMQKLPDVRALARATPERVLKLWEGLGYYARARNLQKAAQWIISHHGGRFPETFDDVIALPGIGRYTAGAICSIGFNQPAPVLDGNVTRVLTRLFGIRENPRDNATDARLWQLAGQLVAHAATQRTHHPSPITLHGWGNCSTLNQSLMELGATVCTPRQAQCAHCPLQSSCVAYRTDAVNALPNLGRRVPQTARRFLAFVVERRGRFLVRQRSSAVVNACLWEFPNIDVSKPGADITDMARRQLGLPVDRTEPLCVIKHSITQSRILLEARLAQITKPAARHRPSGRWLRLRDLEKLAFPSAHRRILDALVERRRDEA